MPSLRAAQAQLQQVHAAVVQEVGCALGGGPHHLLLADHLDRLVVDAQPAVEPDLEDVRGVVAARGAAAVVVDHCKQPIGSVAFKVLIFKPWREQSLLISMSAGY